MFRVFFSQVRKAAVWITMQRALAREAIRRCKLRDSGSPQWRDPLHPPPTPVAPTASFSTLDFKGVVSATSPLQGVSMQPPANDPPSEKVPADKGRIHHRPQHPQHPHVGLWREDYSVEFGEGRLGVEVEAVALPRQQGQQGHQEPQGPCLVARSVTGRAAEAGIQKGCVVSVLAM